jgi:hypothetical protein
MATLGNPADLGRPDLEPSGRDSGALGPSDSSDSGSDIVGSPTARDDGTASDSAGTGERGSAAGREQPAGADILPDRVFDTDRAPDEPAPDEFEDPAEPGAQADETGEASR